MSGPGPLIVVGEDDLALRTISMLTERYNMEVTAIVKAGGDARDQIGRLPGVRKFVVDRVDDEALRRAGVTEATAIALLEADDATNLQTALVAQEINPGVRTVIRTRNLGLGDSVRILLNDCTVLSESEIAADAWIEAALDETLPQPMRIGGRTFSVVRRLDPFVADGAPIGLATVDGQLLGEAPDPDILLASVPGSDSGRKVIRRRPAANDASPFRIFGAIRQPFVTIFAVFVLIIIAGSITLAAVYHAPIDRTFFNAILIVVGQDAVDTNGPTLAVAVQVVLAVASIALIPTIAAAVVDAVVRARLRTEAGVARRMSGHVVLVGLGNLGTRVLRHLVELNVPVIAIERRAQTPGVDLARQLGVPVVIGEATQQDTQRIAQVTTARVLLSTAPDDFSNLELGLTARNIAREIRVVLRIRDGEFASRISRAFNLPECRDPAVIAAPVFAHAMVRPERIHRVLAVGRRVLLITEITVENDSALSGSLLSSVDAVGQIRVCGVWEPQFNLDVLRPAKEQRLAPGTRLLVACTPSGLADLVARARSRYN